MKKRQSSHFYSLEPSLLERPRYQEIFLFPGRRYTSILDLGAFSPGFVTAHIRICCTVLMLQSSSLGLSFLLERLCVDIPNQEIQDKLLILVYELLFYCLDDSIVEFLIFSPQKLLLWLWNTELARRQLQTFCSTSRFSIVGWVMQQPDKSKPESL